MGLSQGGGATTSRNFRFSRVLPDRPLVEGYNDLSVYWLPSDAEPTMNIHQRSLQASLQPRSAALVHHDRSGSEGLFEWKRLRCPGRERRLTDRSVGLYREHRTHDGVEARRDTRMTSGSSATQEIASRTQRPSNPGFRVGPRQDQAAARRPDLRIPRNRAARCYQPEESSTLGRRQSRRRRSSRKWIRSFHRFGKARPNPAGWHRRFCMVQRQGRSSTAPLRGHRRARRRRSSAGRIRWASATAAETARRISGLHDRTGFTGRHRSCTPQPWAARAGRLGYRERCRSPGPDSR